MYQLLPLTCPSIASIQFTMLLNIPLDIFQTIMEWLLNDRATLRSCSLVSRSCRLRAMYYLLRFVRINSRESLNKICTLWFPVESITVSTLPNTPSTLLEVVPVSLIKRGDVRRWGMQSRISSGWVSFSLPTLSCLKACATSIQELYMENVGFSSGVDFIRYLFAFPCVRTVRCVGCQYRVGGGVKHLIPLYKRRLNLSILSVSFIGVHDVLNPADSPTSVQFVEMEPDIAALLIQITRPYTLTDLSFSVDWATRMPGKHIAAGNSEH